MFAESGDAVSSFHAPIVFSFDSCPSWHSVCAVFLCDIYCDSFCPCNLNTNLSDNTIFSFVTQLFL